MNTHSRRQFLAHATLPVAAAVAFTAPGGPVRAAEVVTPIRAAFLRWVDQQHEIRRISGAATGEEMEAACDLGFALAWEVTRLPAEAVSDMALKVYVQMHCEYGERSTANIFDVAVPTTDGIIRDMERALYADAFRFVEPFTIAA